MSLRSEQTVSEPVSSQPSPPPKAQPKPAAQPRQAQPVVGESGVPDAPSAALMERADVAAVEVERLEGRLREAREFYRRATSSGSLLTRQQQEQARFALNQLETEYLNATARQRSLARRAVTVAREEDRAYAEQREAEINAREKAEEEERNAREEQERAAREKAAREAAAAAKEAELKREAEERFRTGSRDAMALHRYAKDVLPEGVYDTQRVAAIAKEVQTGARSLEDAREEIEGMLPEGPSRSDLRDDRDSVQDAMDYGADARQALSDKLNTGLEPRAATEEEVREAARAAYKRWQAVWGAEATPDQKAKALDAILREVEG